MATYQLEPFLWYHKLAIIVVTFVLSAASQKLIEDPLRRAKPFKVPKQAFTLMGSNMALIAAVTFIIPQVVAPEEHEEIAVSECVGADAFLSDCEEPGTSGEPMIPATQVQREAEEPTYPECNIPDGYTNFDRSSCSLGAPEDSAELKIAVIGGESSESITTQAVADMWSGWKKADKEVLVMAELPHFNQMNVPTCVASNPDQLVEKCSLDADDLIGDRGTILADTAQQHSSSVALYDPTLGLCDDQRCYSVVGGLITRYDHHHLSSDFARSYSTDFMRFLEKHGGSNA